MKRLSINKRFKALHKQMLANPNKSILVLYRFYLAWLESFGMNSAYPEFNKTVDGESVLDIELFTLDKTQEQMEARRELSVYPPFYNIFQRLLHLKLQNEIDISYLMNGLVDELSELHPEAVCDHLEAALAGRKIEFQFMTVEEHELIE